MYCTVSERKLKQATVPFVLVFNTSMLGVNYQVCR